MFLATGIVLPPVVHEQGLRGLSTSTACHHSPPPTVGELWGIGSGSTTGERVNISTVLLFEDMGADYTIVRRFHVETILGRGCLSSRQCCVSWNLSAENVC